jgi:uncharacterized radical SAM superfamily Fe-S cluster-containing enzyme
VPKVRPYLFYDATVSLYTECLRRVEAKHVIQDNRVWLYKWWPAHGQNKVLVASDAAYWRQGREVYIKPPRREVLAPYSTEVPSPTHAGHDP